MKPETRIRMLRFAALGTSILCIIAAWSTGRAWVFVGDEQGLQLGLASGALYINNWGDIWHWRWIVHRGAQPFHVVWWPRVHDLPFGYGIVIPFWAVAFLGLTFWYALGRLFMTSCSHSECNRCGYDLSGLGEQCPECGESADRACSAQRGVARP